jgi:hypothetical protein
MGSTMHGADGQRLRHAQEHQYTDAVLLSR